MKSMIVPERLFIHTDKVKELMDNMGKIMVTAYEVWRRAKSEKAKQALSFLSPEDAMNLFIKEISK